MEFKGDMHSHAPEEHNQGSSGHGAMIYVNTEMPHALLA